MPRFPEHGELLTFAEAVELLPNDVKPYAANLVWSMQPLALWEGSPTPHVPRPVPPAWHKRPLHGSSSLELASAAVVQTQDGVKRLTLYFDPKRVKEVGKRYRGSGRETLSWHDVIRKATQAKGARLTQEEALQALRSDGKRADTDKKRFTCDGETLSHRTFTNFLLEAARELHEKQKED